MSLLEAQKPSPKTAAARVAPLRTWALPGVLLIVLITAPFMLGLSGTRLLTTAAILGIFAMSLNLLVGFGGMTSLGHALFFGIGAYSVGLLSHHFALGFAATLPTAILAAAFFAALTGLIIRRARGIAFVMITLASAQVFWGLATQAKSITNGDDGLSGIKSPEIFGMSFGAVQPFYFVVMVAVALTYLLLRKLVQSPFGFALRGTRESERRMAVMGVNVARVRYIAYIISAVIASIAGLLFAYQQRYVGPGVASVSMSGIALLMVVLGGSTVGGPFIGAIIISLIKDSLGSYTDRYLIILGIVFVLTALFLPKGLGGVWKLVNARYGATFRSRRKSDGPETPSGTEREKANEDD
jgi:branched-chain amino acid transport system permease protein